MSRPVPDDRLKDLWRDARGLTDEDVRARRAAYGENQILEPRRGRWIGLVAVTATDPMMWFLLGTSLLFVWVGDLTEAAILAAALIPIAGMDAYLHWRTQASTEGLRDRLAAQARSSATARRRRSPPRISCLAT
jgi:Ca2+-transporting ATPase